MWSSLRGSRVRLVIATRGSFTGVSSCNRESFRLAVTSVRIALFLRESDRRSVRAVRPAKLFDGQRLLRPESCGPKFAFKTIAAGAKMRKPASRAVRAQTRQAKENRARFGGDGGKKKSKKRPKPCCRYTSGIKNRRIVFGALNGRASQYNPPAKRLKVDATMYH